MVGTGDNMQFINNGPDIPDILLQAHEEGKVVFFCGAGISKNAGLSDFKTLTKKLIDKFGGGDAHITKMFDKEEYDRVIFSLEKNIFDGQNRIRSELFDLLQPNTRRKNATSTHEALLKLAKNNDGKIRLITTNFDRLFQIIIKRQKLKYATHQAPLLSPVNERWNSIVYLHGLLPAKKEKDLNNLILSSGDFGLAYLTERWASKFITDVLQRYHICFLGYSIGDPILRYIVDAVAANKMMGEKPLDMFIFDTDKANYDLTNIIPIFYDDANKHIALHATLWQWAEDYDIGVGGKVNIINRDARKSPLSSNKNDDFVGRVLWALGENASAQAFAKLDPAPPLTWLLEIEKFAELLCPVWNNHLEFTDITINLAHWLLRHLNDEKLFLWFVERGGVLNERMIMFIEGELQKPKKEDKDESDAIPDDAMCTLWRLLMAGYCKKAKFPNDVYLRNNLQAYNGGDVSFALRTKIRKALTPYIDASKKFIFFDNEGKNHDVRKITDIIDVKIKLPDDAKDVIDAFKQKNWQQALPQLLSDVKSLLLDALYLLNECDKRKADISILHLPSISDHDQNKLFSKTNWVRLIPIMRDAWLATKASNPIKAKNIAEEWMAQPHFIFKRLAFFTATYTDIIPPTMGLNWLLADDHSLMSSSLIQRETMRLVVALVPKLNDAQREKLENIIIEELPKKYLQNVDISNINEQQKQAVTDRQTWLFLKKIDVAIGLTTEQAKSHLKQLNAKYPHYQLHDNQKEEFSFWSDGIVKGDSFDKQAPETRKELVAWLEKHPKEKDSFHGSNWHLLCQTNFPVTACALYQLTRNDIWLAERWSSALGNWTYNNKRKKITWKYISPILIKADGEFLRKIADALSNWLEIIASDVPDSDEAIFLTLCKKIIDMDIQEKQRIASDYGTMGWVADSINHPIGNVTRAMLNYWLKVPRKTDEKLPEAIAVIFSKLCNTKQKHYIYARVILARSAIPLFQIDKEWTKKHLLPLFDWKHHSQEAMPIWQGFLYAPSLHFTFLETIKEPLLETATKIAEIQKEDSLQSVEQYIRLLTYFSCHLLSQNFNNSSYKKQDFQKAFNALSSDSLKYAIFALRDDLPTIDDNKKQAYWNKRIKLFMTEIYPHSKDKLTNNIIRFLGKLCIESGIIFGEVFDTLKPYIEHRKNTQPQQNDGFVFHGFCDNINESNIAGKFPEQILEFLYFNYDEYAHVSRVLRNILDDIKTAKPELQQHPYYKKLDGVARNWGC